MTRFCHPVVKLQIRILCCVSKNIQVVVILGMTSDEQVCFRRSGLPAVALKNLIWSERFIGNMESWGWRHRMEQVDHLETCMFIYLFESALYMVL